MLAKVLKAICPCYHDTAPELISPGFLFKYSILVKPHTNIAIQFSVPNLAW